MLIEPKNMNIVDIENTNYLVLCFLKSHGYLSQVDEWLSLENQTRFQKVVHYTIISYDIYLEHHQRIECVNVFMERILRKLRGLSELETSEIVDFWYSKCMQSRLEDLFFQFFKKIYYNTIA